MNFEQLPQQISRLESLLRVIQESPEDFDDLEASMLFLEVNSSDFRRSMLELGKLGKAFSLVFTMDDMGKTDLEKRSRLRQLKAIHEDIKLKNIIQGITVKGRAGEQMIEPNVFSSDVRFVVES